MPADRAKSDFTAMLKNGGVDLSWAMRIGEAKGESLASETPSTQRFAVTEASRGDSFVSKVHDSSNAPSSPAGGRFA